MPVDFYPNKSVQELLKMLDQVQSRQVSGAISEVTAAGVRTVRQFGGVAGNSKTDAAILRILYSLHKRSAGTDEADNFPNPYVTRITRTSATYRLT
jgi:hypothetical protein